MICRKKKQNPYTVEEEEDNSARVLVNESDVEQGPTQPQPVSVNWIETPMKPVKTTPKPAVTVTDKDYIID